MSSDFCSDVTYQVRDKNSNCVNSMFAKFNNYRSYGTHCRSKGDSPIEQWSGGFCVRALLTGMTTIQRLQRAVKVSLYRRTTKRSKYTLKKCSFEWSVVPHSKMYSKIIPKKKNYLCVLNDQWKNRVAGICCGFGTCLKVCGFEYLPSSAFLF